MSAATGSGDAMPMRIVVEAPPQSVAFALQRGRDELLRPCQASAAALVFEFELRLGRTTNGRPNVLGAYAQGTPSARFVYVTSGVRAGQPDSCWDRRAKVMLSGIDTALLQHALDAPRRVLEARFAGTGRDGGPACATVPLLGDGWRLA